MKCVKEMKVEIAGRKSIFGVMKKGGKTGAETACCHKMGAEKISIPFCALGKVSFRDRVCDTAQRGIKDGQSVELWAEEMGSLVVIVRKKNWGACKTPVLERRRY